MDWKYKKYNKQRNANIVFMYMRNKMNTETLNLLQLFESLKETHSTLDKYFFQGHITRQIFCHIILTYIKPTV